MVFFNLVDPVRTSRIAKHMTNDLMVFGMTGKALNLSLGPMAGAWDGDHEGSY